MKILVIANTKGGSGKTTTVFNLAHDLSKAGKKVVLIDFDPQASLTNCFKVDLAQDQIYIEDLVSREGYGKLSILNAIVCPKEGNDNLMLVPSSGALGKLDGELKNTGMGRLREVLKGLHSIDIDVVLIDPPGSSDSFMSAALVAADEVIIPSKATDLDINTLTDFVALINEHKEFVNKDLMIRGILLNQTLTASKNADFYLESLEKAGLGGLILKSKIRSTIDAANSIAYGKSATEYKPKSPVSQDYKELAKEISKWL